ncbi:hypothetical protein ACTG15_13720 [Aeromonas sp. 164P]
MPYDLEAHLQQHAPWLHDHQDGEPHHRGWAIFEARQGGSGKLIHRREQSDH